MATVTGTKRHLGITSNTFDSNGDVVVGGNLTINGTTTTLDTANLLVEDKNIIIGNVSTPSDTTADGGGITLKGASDYTINWVNANDRWEFNQGIYSSGPITSAGQITGTELEGTSLDINGTGDFTGKVNFQGDAAIEGGSGYGVFKGYTANDNHFISVRGAVANTSTLTITGAHQTTFVEHADAANEGWYFKSFTTGTYREIARIDGLNEMYLGGNQVYHEGHLPTLAELGAAADTAEANVQADWNETTTTSDAFIQNKPTIPSGNQVIDWTQSGAGTIHTDNYIENVVQTTVSGNAGTVTNGVYTSGDQTIAGTKNFSGILEASGTVKNVLSQHYVEIYIYGDDDKYYPVTISGASSHFGYQKYHVSRRYNWTAPSTWNTSTHQGALSLTWEHGSDTAWGGNDKEWRVIQFDEVYSTLCNGMILAVTEGMVVWLRGGGTGGAMYRVSTPQGAGATVKIYDNKTSGASGNGTHVASTTFTAGNGTAYAAESYSSANVDSRIKEYWPIRGKTNHFRGQHQIYAAIDEDNFASNSATRVPTQQSTKAYISSFTPTTVTTNANLTGHVTSTGNATVLGSFTTAELNAAISDGTVNSQTLPTDFVSAANGGTFSAGITIDADLSGTGDANRGFTATKTNLGAVHAAGGEGGVNTSADTTPMITIPGNTAGQVQGGIYASQNSSTGTSISIFTTDSYSTGPQQSLTIIDNGNVSVDRGTLSVSGNITGANLSGTNTGDQTLPTDFVSKANGGQFDGVITIKEATSTAMTSGKSILTLHNDNSDISQQQSFIDFKFTDTNANYTPQVRIGAQVGPDADANSIDKEGAGSFVVYTSPIGNNNAGGSTGLSEAFRVSYNKNATFGGNIIMGSGKTVDGVDISALPTTFAPTDAEQNVQSDWNATSGDALILNKPSIPAASGKGQNNNYIASNLPSSNSTYRDNFGAGVWAYSGYSTGADRPFTYDASLQVMATANIGFELSTAWHSTGEGTLKIRALRDCCEGWGSYYDVWTSAHFANNSANWDAAYSYGDHAAAGYLDTDSNLLKSDADDTFTGRLSVGSTNSRRAGIYGIYDSYKIGHIWSMGTAYMIPSNGSDFGNLYGFAYKHTNNTTGGTMGGGHQAVWCTGGTPRASIGESGIWTTGNVTHTGLTMTDGTDIDQIKSYTKSLTLTNSWLDTGVNGSELATGTYIVQVSVNNSGANGQQYDELYSGTMSWYSGNSNSSNHDEIVLHAAGHARNDKSIFLRVLRTVSANTDDLKLQITSNRNATQTASNYIFKFRRMI